MVQKDGGYSKCAFTTTCIKGSILLSDVMHITVHETHERYKKFGDVFVFFVDIVYKVSLR